MLQYLTKWREITPEFIEQLGYKSESAFRQTFKKVTRKNTNTFKFRRKNMPLHFDYLQKPHGLR